ncbi:MAG: glycogen synthase [Spirochaetales bacterium]|jgi:starch synthase|nr:glycogen synthase [Spirochaetales bacterium]
MQKDSLKILMVSSEAAPFAKVGGLGEAVSSLAAELSLQGHDVRMLLPRYYSIDTVKEQLRKHPSPLGIPMGTREEWTGVYEGLLPNSRVPVYFLDHEKSYGRDGVYGGRGELGYADNVARFALLCRGAFQLCRMIGWLPDIIHSHDWPAALCSVYLKSLESRTEFAQTAAVLTLHNASYQGVFSKDNMPAVGLAWEHFYSSGFEFYDQVNLLQAGIKNADTVTTVSPGYAREILTPEKGSGMDGLLRSRGERFTGILNGIDYSVWDPETDPFLPCHFCETDITGKEKLKSRLKQEIFLTVDQDKPLIGMVSRLAEQKGFGILLEYGRKGLASICRELDLQMVILGTGNVAYEQELARLAWKLPNLKVILQFNTQLAHLIEGGADFFLMPSVFEPCGLNQLYSLRYGAIPIVSRTGGLSDTVENYDETTGKGTGIIIDPVNSESIYDAVKRAVGLYKNNKKAITAMRLQGMKKRFSWTNSAKQYIASYTQAIKAVQKSPISK